MRDNNILKRKIHLTEVLVRESEKPFQKWSQEQWSPQACPQRMLQQYSVRDLLQKLLQDGVSTSREDRRVEKERVKGSISAHLRLILYNTIHMIQCDKSYLALSSGFQLWL